MNWGKGVALALFAFACMMAWFMVKASQNPEPLVTEDYYGEELRFQERIDEAERANALSSPVRMECGREGVTLRFPAELDGLRISGTIGLLRPNAPEADRSSSFVLKDTTMLFTAMQLLPGRYNIALSWKANGIDYFTEEKVFVP